MKHSKLLLLLVFLVYSCSNNERNSLGTENKIAKTKYEKIYYVDGTLKAIVPSINDSIHGLTQEFYKNGNLKEIRRYENNILNGLVYTYLNYGSIKKSEVLCINNKQIVKGIVGNLFETDTLYGTTYYYPEDMYPGSDLVPAGSVFYTMAGQLNALSTNYYRILSKDTISYGDKYNL